MVSVLRAALAAMFVAVFSVNASAQATLSVPEGLVQGQDITISYSDASRAGGAVTVEIDDGGFPVATVVTVTIQLDGQGKGSAKWRVPEWGCASFNAPGVSEVTREIYGGSASKARRTLPRMMARPRDGAID